MINKFSYKELDLKGAFLLNPFVVNDNRGKFIKDYSLDFFSEIGIVHDLKEVFYTHSYSGVIRAIHFQNIKQQAKLVRCITGKIYDVIVDLRKDSPTFGQYQGVILSSENMCELYIPENFGHGYLVIDNSIVSYKCSEKFYAEYDDGIIWNDIELNIDWPTHLIKDKIILSEKDKSLMSFSEYKIQTL